MSSINFLVRIFNPVIIVIEIENTMNYIRIEYKEDINI